MTIDPRPTHLSALAACLFLVSCDCERGPCEATDHAQQAAEIKQGVVGLVAYRTDACESSCCECSWSTAELTVWTSPDELTDQEAVKARVAKGPPTERFSVDRRYEHKLDTGYHLLCESESCASLTIDKNLIVTVNLQQVYGPTQFKVFVAGKLEPALVFDVGSAITDNPDAGGSP